MTSQRRVLNLGWFAASGGIAGAFSALIFTAVHQLLISRIWFAIVAMLVAGIACGTSLAWSYALAIGIPSLRSWIQYNACYVAILIGLGLTSLAAFEPVTTIAQLLQSSEPPRGLIARAFPMTVLFIAGSATMLTALYRPRWRGAAAILVTTVLIVLVLGLNISILGLVSVQKTQLVVIAEVLALVIVLAVVYTAFMAYLWRHQFEIATAPPNDR